MTAANGKHVKAIFHEALEKPVAERVAFLESACGENQALRTRVDALLSAFDEADDFLAAPTDAGMEGSTISPASQLSEGPGTVIDRYKLLQEIGEGGFGVVYMAEQQEPVRRKVALKIIKLGMDTKQVVARFEAERQALAMMDHPNIAKVLDGGATESGRSYFVMELVKGVSITGYCDKAVLDTSQRLVLFQQVCHAIQHAHHKGIIHRDIKPSNVLVTLHDGVPIPKVIDFGIAKATDRRLTERTLFTEFQQMLGTPEYMSPEQAEMSGLDVDTRADIYSLGVLLYELLTGTRPLDLRTLRDAGYMEILRQIREVEPPKPSTRISTLGESLAEVARHRHVQPGTLQKLVAGDLDWIVMKALEKDRSRRYETANAFADDIGRFLQDLPVLASPPGRVYRLRKYYRRHKVGVMAGVLVGLSLVVGLGVATYGLFEATTQRDLARDAERDAVVQKTSAETAQKEEHKQRQRAEQSEAEARKEAVRAQNVIDLLQSMLSSADPDELKGKNYTVRQLLDDFDRDFKSQLKDQPEVEATIRMIMGKSYHGLGIYDKAERHLREAIAIWRRELGDEHADTGASMKNLTRCLRGLALVLRDGGRLEEAEALCRERLGIVQKTLGDAHSDFASTLTILATIQMAGGKLADAEKALRRALEIQLEKFGEEHDSTASTLGILGHLLGRLGKLPEAEKLLRRTLAVHKKLFGKDHPSLATDQNNLAVILQWQGRLSEAAELYRKSLATERKRLAKGHPSLNSTLFNLGVVLRDLGKLDEAESLMRESLAIQEKSLGEDSLHVGKTLSQLGSVMEMRGQLEEAEKHCARALAIMRKQLGNEHIEVASTLNALTTILRSRDKLEEAEPLIREELALRRKLLGEGHLHVARVSSNLGNALRALGKLDEAEQFLRQAMGLYPKHLPETHPEYLACIGILAEVLCARGEFSASETLSRKTLELYRKGKSTRPLDMAACLLWLGRALLEQERYAEAEPFLRECLRIRGQHMQPGYWRQFNTKSHLGLALAGQGKKDSGKFTEALPLLIEGFEGMQPPPRWAACKREALERIVKLYEWWGKGDEAVKWRARLEANKK